MALNLNDKKQLCSQILAEAEFNISSTGITVHSERLSTPRFLPFDQPGRCHQCRSTDLEIDYVVTKEGITVFCNRIKGTRFIHFDAVYELPGHCFFKVRNKGRIFSVPHGDEKPAIQYLTPEPANKLSLTPKQSEMADDNALMEPPLLEPQVPYKQPEEQGPKDQIAKENNMQNKLPLPSLQYFNNSQNHSHQIYSSSLLNNNQQLNH